jgi:L-fuculose-phosphate aldolase
MNDLQKKFEKEIDELARASNRIAELGYVTSHGGNVSYRADENVILITPTKVPKADIQFNDVCIIDPKGNVLFAAEGRKPTGETPFHIDILNKRPDLNALIHAHPPYLTGLAIAHDNTLSKPLLPEPVTEVGPVLHVPYAEPISQELADAFDPLLYKTNAWLMLNHGVLIGSYEGIWRGTELLELIEATAQSVAVAAIVGEIHMLSREDVKKLDNVMFKRNLPFPGGPKGGTRSLVDVFLGNL